MVPANPRYFKQNPELLETYLTMTLQFISWVLSLVLFLALVFLFTELLKLVQRVCGFLDLLKIRFHFVSKGKSRISGILNHLIYLQ